MLNANELLNLLLECGQKPEQAAQVKEDLVIPLISVVRDFGGELRPLVTNFHNFIIERKIEAYKRFTDAGIAPEHAVSLINADVVRVQNSLKK